MRICVWRTGHEIADKVSYEIYHGLQFCNHLATIIAGADEVYNNKLFDSFDIHMGYGILRGSADVWKKCKELNKPYFIVDRGYFKPGHYDGYYRVSLRGTQQTGGWPAPDYERWERLGLSIAEPLQREGYMLYCPPTDFVSKYLGLMEWMSEKVPGKYRIREKGCERSLDDDLAGASRIITFNSSVGWEALRRGIPVESDPLHSIVGAWAKTHDLMATRRELFATMSSMQLTLDEMRQGQLYPLMQKFLDADNLNKA